jgi:ABC-type transport system involved in cytochrome c biogenesis permease subunit
MGKKLVLGWQPQWSVVSSAVSYQLKVPIMEKYVLISTCILCIVHDVLWLFSETPLFKTMSSLGDLVIHGFKICLRYVYSHAPYNDGPHIWRRSPHKTIIL